MTKEVKHSVDAQLIETESVASAITQMSATVREVARAAEAASDAAQMADEASNSGRRVVQATIGEITNVASEVEKIIVVMTALDTQSTELATLSVRLKTIIGEFKLHIAAS